MIGATISFRHPKNFHPSMGLSFTDLEKGLNNVFSILQDMQPVVKTVKEKRGEIERIITVVAKNEKQITNLIEQAGKIAPIITTTVKQLEPLITPKPGQTKSDLQKTVDTASWFIENPGWIAVGIAGFGICTVLAGVYAATQLAKPKPKEKRR
jgi:hypothetical protein